MGTSQVWDRSSGFRLQEEEERDGAVKQEKESSREQGRQCHAAEQEKDEEEDHAATQEKEWRDRDEDHAAKQEGQDRRLQRFNSRTPFVSTDVGTFL